MVIELDENRLWKLKIHSSSEESPVELMVNKNNEFGLKVGDVVHVYDPYAKLKSSILVKISDIKQTPKTDERYILFDQTAHKKLVANEYFQLPQFQKFYIEPLPLDDVTLDLVEIVCKDQFLNRSDTWRLKMQIIDTCVYYLQRLEYCHMKTTLTSLICKGEQVKCGYVNERTRFAFRSASAAYNIFIQMSSEMWECDPYGDLYFEKCAQFLTELFTKWKSQEPKCCHDVTITMFSRIYYETERLKDFPDQMRSSIKQERNRFYEDFYHVITQNERFEDWSHTITLLKKHFLTYKQCVVNYQQNLYSDHSIPNAYNSPAMCGNILEIFNMSLNLFENYHIDRNFDRSHHLSLVISPGNGVYFVDRKLATITRNRVTNSGVNCDLVCLGEQPLHAAPLFVFPSKEFSNMSEDYNVPIWINIGYYESQSINNSHRSFEPQIKLPICGKKFCCGTITNTVSSNLLQHSSSHDLLKVINVRPYRRSVDAILTFRKENDVQRELHHDFKNLIRIRSLTTINKHLKLLNRQCHDDTSLSNPVLLYRKEACKPKPLVNPFNPKTLKFKVNAYCRRWGHLFPENRKSSNSFRSDLQLQFIQSGLESVDMVVRNSSRYNSECSNVDYIGRKDTAHSEFNFTGKSPDSPFFGQSPMSIDGASDIGIKHARRFERVFRHAPKENIYATIWGITGERQWHPSIKITADWKSLTMPASLPLTTDFLPNSTNLPYEYNFNKTGYVPENICEPGKVGDIFEIFNEMILQRLNQGFQIVQKPGTDENGPYILGHSKYSARSHVPIENYRQVKQRVLSCGKIFHQLAIEDNGRSIAFRSLKPRHDPLPEKGDEIVYRYRFKCPDSDTFDLPITIFKDNRPTYFNYSKLDHYIITRGHHPDYHLEDTTVYYRSRFFLLPSENKETSDITDGPPDMYCDIYPDKTELYLKSLSENSCKFMMSMNKLRYKLAQRRCSRISLDNDQPSGTVLRQNSEDILPSKIENMSSKDLLAAMTHLRNGLDFIDDDQNRLPPFTFLSIDFSNWLKRNFADVLADEHVIDHLRKLLEDQKICHASGYFNYPLTIGCVMFFIVQDKKQVYEQMEKSLHDPLHFIFTVGEVTPVLCKYHKFNPSAICQVSDDDLQSMLKARFEFPIQQIIDAQPANGFPRQFLQSIFFRVTKVEIEGNIKRPEWAICRYMNCFCPYFAYELEIKWLVATGSLLSESVKSFARKADQLDFHLLPVSLDPFAMPDGSLSDPMRGPIYIPLNLENLNLTKPELCKGQRLLLFQDFILRRFGFLSMVHATVNNMIPQPPVREFQYVHCTGGMFVLFVDNEFSDGSGNNCSLAERGINMYNRPNVGFLWAWNSMLSQSWKTVKTGSIAFLDKMLADFKRVCSDSEERLTKLSEI